jgi:hypothetical protein
MAMITLAIELTCVRQNHTEESNLVRRYQHGPQEIAQASFQARPGAQFISGP